MCLVIGYAFFYVEYNVTILNLLSNILSLSFCAAISMYCVRVRCHNTYRKALLLSSRNEQGRFYFPDVTGNCFHGGTFLLLAKYMFQNFLSPVNRFAQRIAIDWATALARSFDYNFWHKNEVQKFWRRRRGHVEAEWVGAVSRISDSLRTIIAPP